MKIKTEADVVSWLKNNIFKVYLYDNREYIIGKRYAVTSKTNGDIKEVVEIYPYNLYNPDSKADFNKQFIKWVSIKMLKSIKSIPSEEEADNVTK